MNKIPVMVMRNKANAERYLAANVDVGDWEDENLDVKSDDIQNAYMIIRKDLSIPTVADFEEHKESHSKIKSYLKATYGEDFFISLDFEAVCEHYDPINIEITQEQYKFVLEMTEE